MPNGEAALSGEGTMPGVAMSGVAGRGDNGAASRGAGDAAFSGAWKVMDFIGAVGGGIGAFVVGSFASLPIPVPMRNELGEPDGGPSNGPAP